MGGVCSVVSLDEKAELLYIESDFVEQLAVVQTRLGNGAPGASAKTKCVTVNVELLETILIEVDDSELAGAQGLKCARGRKGTGYVTMEQVDRLRNHVSFQLEDSDAQVEEKSRIRKGTGFVSTAALFELLNDIDDEEEDEPKPDDKMSKLQGSPQTGDFRPQIKSAPKRNGRKGTGFVTKAKLNKVLEVVGTEEDE